ncbi:MAG: recO [Anaerospora sp.]|nr:recO [Anaerospora sp.]
MNMARQYVTEAILLAVRDSAHADRMVTLFSREHGKFQAIAHGARQPKSRLGGCLQPFASIRAAIAGTTGVETITQCEIINSFRELRDDITLLSYAAFLSELVSELWPERQPDEFVYDMLLTAYHTLPHRNPRITALASGWQLVALAGFHPEYSVCVNCGRALDQSAGFSCDQGGCICHYCQQEPLPEFGLPAGELMDKLLKLDWQQPDSFSVNSRTLLQLENILYSYLEYHLGKPLKSLSFIKQLARSSVMDKASQSGDNKG